MARTVNVPIVSPQNTSSAFHGQYTPAQMQTGIALYLIYLGSGQA